MNRKTIDMKRISVDLTEDWSNVFRPKYYNWVSFNLFKFYYESDRMHGCREFVIHLLGFGVRVYWVYNKKQAEEQAKKYRRFMNDEEWKVITDVERYNKEDYTEQELKEYLKNKGYSYDKFQEYMIGQTVGIDENGKTLYYSYDIERYRE